MRLGLRLFFGFFVITGIAALILLRVFLAEVKPSVSQVMEDLMVDVAHLMAEAAAPELQAMPAGGTLQGGAIEQTLQRYAQRFVDADIGGHHKRTLDLRLYITDANGRLVLDSGAQAAPGTDFSRWRDVALTLRGEYGARTTRELPGDDRSAVFFVAAPVQYEGRRLGVLTVAKAVATVQPMIDRAQRRISIGGAWLMGSSLLIGVAVTLWAVHAVRQLRRYAERAEAGSREAPPYLPGELGELALAMGQMRQRLDSRAQVEQVMRAFTHELKSPLAAIGGAAELLQDPLDTSNRERFALQIRQQVQRLRELVERLLELSKLDSLVPIDQATAHSLRALVQAQLEALKGAALQRGIRWSWLGQADAEVPCDPERLALAVANLLSNALAFAPAGSVIELGLHGDAGRACLSVRDHGPGVPEYAVPRLGERFFSTPRPSDGERGSGLGLAIVRQVAALHGGTLAFDDAQPGLRVTLSLPLA
jgi:two-component system, OmpR family, sensor histidine kinase CreC